MNPIKFFAVLFILFGFGINSSQAQAIVKQDFYWWLYTYDSRYPAVETMEVKTPSGNILHKQTYQISTGDRIVPEKGVKKYTFTTRVSHNGIRYTLVDAEGLVFADGKVIIIFHSNGAGNETPPN